MSSLTLLNLKTPPAAPVIEAASSVKTEPELPTMDCDKRPALPRKPLDPKQVLFEGPKAVGSQLVHPTRHDTAGKASFPEDAPQHGPANINFDAIRGRDLGFIGVEKKPQSNKANVVGSCLIVGQQR